MEKPPSTTSPQAGPLEAKPPEQPKPAVPSAAASGSKLVFPTSRRRHLPSGDGSKLLLPSGLALHLEWRDHAYEQIIDRLSPAKDLGIPNLRGKPQYKKLEIIEAHMARGLPLRAVEEGIRFPCADDVHSPQPQGPHYHCRYLHAVYPIDGKTYWIRAILDPIPGRAMSVAVVSIIRLHLVSADR